MLKRVQETFPVFLDVLSPPMNFPRQVVTPVLLELKKKALAPFDTCVQVTDTNTTVAQGDDVLTFFPSLPQIRHRRQYEADVERKVQLCNKKYSKHPSLTPGIFTLFCPHGELL